ncbi:MAG: Ig-like domain-containing protein, partial [Thermoplasmata archaeon]|nr:Ig-like domain-containing protein [Thermoplasmata archaeon]
MWDPSPVQASETTIVYSGAELLDGETYYFRVRTKDNDGSRWGAWSENKIFRFNTPPNVISLEPTNGTYIHSINITWSTEDDEFDVTNITIEAYYNSQWQELVNLTSASYFNWDVSSISPQEVDLRAKCWDGLEFSSGWFNPDSTILIFKNSEPMILLISPPPGEFEVNELIKIHWVIYDSDLDDVHTVDLYYDTNKDLAEKTLIKKGITDIDWYIWETVNIPEGKYYICAVVHDESALNYTYSSGLIVVNHTIPRGPPPKISFVFPPDGSMDVPVTSDIWVQFDNHIDPSSLSKSNFYVMDTAGLRIPGKTIYDVEKMEARYEPELNLSYNETYIAIVMSDVRDLEGNRLDGDGNGIMDKSPIDDYLWFFRTKPLEGDVTPPQVVSTTPETQETNVENSTIITITFSEAMDKASLVNNVMIYDVNFEFIEIQYIYYDEDTNTLTIILKDKLADNMTYTVLITADVKDSSGKNLDGNGNGVSEGPPWDNYEFIFTTGEVIVPPANGKDPNGNDTDPREADESENRILTYLPLIVVLIIILILGISMVFYRRHRQGKFIVNNILIIYNDGRLLTRYHRKSENAIDDSAVSSMLTAIQDFIRESFKESRKSAKSQKDDESEPEEDKSSVDELKYGKLKILIEYDEKFYIAVIGEGKEAPPKLRKELKKIKSRINSKYNKVLEYWDGNMAPVKGMR